MRSQFTYIITLNLSTLPFISSSSFPLFHHLSSSPQIDMLETPNISHHTLVGDDKSKSHNASQVSHEATTSNALPTATTSLHNAASIKDVERDANGGTMPPPGIVTEVTTKPDKYLHGKKLIAVHSGLMTAVFLVALDQSIVATALPKLASEFSALKEVSWVVSSYFRTYLVQIC